MLQVKIKFRLKFFILHVGRFSISLPPSPDQAKLFMNHLFSLYVLFSQFRPCDIL